VNVDDLRRTLDQLAGPEPAATTRAYDAVRHRARIGRARRVALVAVTVMALIGATTITVRALDTRDRVSVSSPSNTARPTDWSAFCAQAAKIQAASEPGPSADPSLSLFQSRFAHLIRLAPTRQLQHALADARPYLVMQPRTPPPKARTALQTVDHTLADHCGRTVLDVFKIGYQFLVTPSRSPSVTSVALGDLVPSEIVGGDGALWMMASHGGGTNPDQCVLAKLDPLSGSTATFPLPTCGFNATAGGGSLYFESNASIATDFTREIRILKVDTATGAATPLDPVALSVKGSSIAHTQLAYADGSLWLWGMVGGDGQLNQVSPDTGAVERTFASLPPIGGTEPLITSTPGQLWLAGGSGGGATLSRLDTKTGLLTNGPSLGTTGAGNILWLTSLNSEVFAGVFDATGSGGAGGTFHVFALNDDGTVRTTTTVDQFGATVTSGDVGVWMLGPGATCKTGEPLIRVDPASLSARVVTTLRPSFNPCTVGGFRRFAAVGTHLFALDTDTTQANTRLYRITP